VQSGFAIVSVFGSIEVPVVTAQSDPLLARISGELGELGAIRPQRPKKIAPPVLKLDPGRFGDGEERSQQAMGPLRSETSSYADTVLRNAVSLRISVPAESSSTAVAGSCTELSVVNRATSASASSFNVTPLAKRSSTRAISPPAR
jgi:hypothetical protein